MKYRRDFVTNSSSSSFICVFENQDEFNKRMQILLAVCSSKEFCATIYSDLEKSTISRGAVESILREDAEDIYDWQHIWNAPGDWKELSEKRETPEYQADREAFVKQHVKEFFDACTDESVFCHVEYGDDDGDYFGELEHEIMPRMPFVKGIVSHH